MANYKNLFMSYMDSEGVRYTELDTEKNNVVKVVYNGDNLKSIAVFVFFDSDGDPLVQLKCWDIANFKGKEDKAIRVCNDLNATYRWVKFYVDSDNEVTAAGDAIIDDETAGEECYEIVQRYVNIIDDVYPRIMKVIWA